MKVNVACTQMACNWEIESNVNRAESLVRRAAAQGAQIILLQELFATPYFCIDSQECHFDLARPLQGNPIIERFQAVARELVLGNILPLEYPLLQSALAL